MWDYTKVKNKQKKNRIFEQAATHSTVQWWTHSGGNPDVAVGVGLLAVWNIPDPWLIWKCIIVYLKELSDTAENVVTQWSDFLKMCLLNGFIYLKF